MKPLTSIATFLLLVNRALDLHPLLVIELVHLVDLQGLGYWLGRSRAGVSGQQAGLVLHWLRNLSNLVPSGSPPHRIIRPNPKLSCPFLPENWERTKN